MELSRFALSYTDDESAQYALKVFRKLHRAGCITLSKALLVNRNAEGELVTDNNGGLKLFDRKYGMGGAVGTAIGLMGAAPLGPGAIVMGGFMGAVGTGVMIGYENFFKGMGDTFRREVEDSLSEGSSAVIIEAEIVQPEMTLKVLNRLKGGEFKVSFMNEELADQFAEALNE